MADDARQAHRVLVVLGDYEWEIENAWVSVSKYGVDIWHDDDGERRKVVTAPLAACFIEWESLEELLGVIAEDLDDIEDLDDEEVN